MTVNTEFLKEILAKRNWSMRKLAYKAGVSQATLSRVFNGKRGVGAISFNAIRKTFPDIPLDKLFFFKPIKLPNGRGVTHLLSVVITLKRFFEN
jgi:transcriptional regulator with XRE-family HTH domain